MSVHATIELIKYKWKAKGRHGTHSPFVYDFIEQVLMNKAPLNKELLVTCPTLDLKYENLLNRIAQHYRYYSVLQLPLTDNVMIAPSADLIVLDNNSPAQWLHLYDQYSVFLENESAVAVLNIHQTSAHSAAWAALCKMEPVRMSLDMYGIGLLLFKKEFKEKQHFILKY